MIKHASAQSKDAATPAFKLGNGLLLQRKCACGSPSSSLTGECAECKTKKRLQTKLTIGASNDPLEQEADRVADQVLAAPANPAVSGAAPRIQRYTGQATGQTDTAPASVDHVLAASGRPLGTALRQDMEQRFGHDFSRVRVHSGAAAEQSARDVSAYAYTAGHNIVFGAGRFAPGTHEGRRLIAHELAHVVQQNQTGTSIQRATGTTGCAGYEHGEADRSRTAEGFLDLDVAFANFYGISRLDAVVIGDFGVDDAELKSSTRSELRRKNSWIDIFENHSTEPLEVLGFSDCVGGEHGNTLLRARRAQAVADLFPRSRSRMRFVGAAPINQSLVDNATMRGRALNRSVVIRSGQPAPAPTPQPKAPIPSPPTVTITLHEPDTENCSPQQRFELAVAYPAAKLMLEHALIVISDMSKGSEEEIILMKYFGKDAFSHRWHIKQQYVDALRAWSGDPNYECVKQGADPCETGTLGYTGAKALLTGSPIVICEEAFGHGDVHLAEVVLHEESHALSWTRDKQYCDPQTGCTLDTETAEVNADSYSGFARDAFNRWY